MDPFERVTALPLATAEEVASDAMAGGACLLRLDRLGVVGAVMSAPAVSWPARVDSESSGNGEGPDDRLRLPRT